MEMKYAKQMSESIELGIILAIGGGFMDAYSYMCRDHVFANAQTGNILLLGVNLADGRWNMAIRYLFPVMAFILGIILAEFVREVSRDKSILHWRQTAVICEAGILIAVAFIPQNYNLLANSLTSLACGIQVESFRKIQGNGIATTMCIGNLRSGTQNLYKYRRTRDKEKILKGMLYYGIILFFILGAVIGNAAVKEWKEKAIIGCSIFLLLAFGLMFVDREKQEGK